MVAVPPDAKVKEHMAPGRPGVGKPSPMTRSATGEDAGAPVTVIRSMKAL